MNTEKKINAGERRKKQINTDKRGIYKKPQMNAEKN